MRNRNIIMRASSSSSSEADPLILELERYSLLKFSSGLDCEASAVRELAILFRRTYPDLISKGVQQALYSDMVLAVQKCDRRNACKLAVDEMIQVAKRLPKQKRQQLLREYKQVCLMHERQTKSRQEPLIVLEQTSEDAILSFDTLPQDIIQSIIQHLDPIALATFSSCSRQLRNTVLESDSVWDKWSKHLFSKGHSELREHKQSGSCDVLSDSKQSASAGCSHTCYNSFREQVLGLPSALQPWRCWRIMIASHPCWLHPHGYAPAGSYPTSTKTSRGKKDRSLRKAASPYLSGSPYGQEDEARSEAVYLTETMVIDWLLGRSEIQVRASSSSSNSSCDDNDANAEKYRLRTQLKLWSVNAL